MFPLSVGLASSPAGWNGWFGCRRRPIKQLNTKAWRRALERAGVGDFRWHDLRHYSESRIIPSSLLGRGQFLSVSANCVRPRWRSSRHNSDSLPRLSRRLSMLLERSNGDDPRFIGLLDTRSSLPCQFSALGDPKQRQIIPSTTNRGTLIQRCLLARPGIIRNSE